MASIVKLWFSFSVRKKKWCLLCSFLGTEDVLGVKQLSRTAKWKHSCRSTSFGIAIAIAIASLVKRND